MIFITNETMPLADNSNRQIVTVRLTRRNRDNETGKSLATGELSLIVPPCQAAVAHDNPARECGKGLVADLTSHLQSNQSHDNVQCAVLQHGADFQVA